MTITQQALLILTLTACKNNCDVEITRLYVPVDQCESVGERWTLKTSSHLSGYGRRYYDYDYICIEGRARDALEGNDE